MTLSEKKCALRQKMAGIVAGFCRDRERAQSASAAAADKLMQSRLWQDAAAVLLYVSTPCEADTHRLIVCAMEQGKQVGLPRVAGRGIMDFHCMENSIPLDKQLETGKYGIMEPLPSLPVISALPHSTLIVCPGVAFTHDGWRLGHGGGYYDRYIARMGADAMTAGLCFECQVIASIPHDEFDIRMDEVFVA